jgi:type II secretory pathway pseudopilin PulG
MRRRGFARGYTAVEVMLAITVLLISSAGVMSMQKAAIQGNLDARRLDVANSIARLWLDRLTTDASTWNSTSATTLTNTLWINANLDTGTFMTPQALPSGAPIYSPAFDILGRDLPNIADPTAVYCVHVKIDTMATTTAAPAGPVLLRATVLVFWPKNLLFAAGAPSNPLCPGPSDVAAVESSTPGTYHMLFTTEALRRGS